MQENFDKLNKLISYFSNIDLSKNIHHVGIIAPNYCDENWFAKNCDEFIFHKKQDAILGFIEYSNLILEFIRPISEKSVLSNHLDEKLFKFDHFCYLNQFNTENLMIITKKFYTPLFNKDVQFFYDKSNKLKIEIIYDSSQ